MSLYRVSVTLTGVLAVALRAAEPAEARVKPEPGDLYVHIEAPAPRKASGSICLSVMQPVDQCAPGHSLAQRRLIHADLIRTLPDGS